MSEPSAKVILDSISPWGDRLTTMEVKMHRFVLAEFNTHRAFSRNSASSRAIPVAKQILRVIDDPAIPISFPSEKPGMQGGSELEGQPRENALRIWHQARMSAVTHAEHLVGNGVHKSIVNRLLEPFMWHTVIVSSTEWDNFWRQRCSPLAQPEMRAAAEAMKAAYDVSTPRLCGLGEWHTPLILPEDIFTQGGQKRHTSAARCARVSYLTHDGVRDIKVDLDLYGKLVSADPEHASPLEHVATPQNPNVGDVIPGNFRGWRQLRHEVFGA